MSFGQQVLRIVDKYPHIGASGLLVTLALSMPFTVVPLRYLFIKYFIFSSFIKLYIIQNFASLLNLFPPIYLNFILKYFIYIYNYYF